MEAKEAVLTVKPEETLKAMYAVQALYYSVSSLGGGATSISEGIFHFFSNFLYLFDVCCMSVCGCFLQSARELGGLLHLYYMSTVSAAFLYLYVWIFAVYMYK